MTPCALMCLCAADTPQPTQLLAVFLGTTGMYITGTLWTAPRTGPLRGSYSNIHQQQGVGVGRRGVEEEALPRRSSAAGRREQVCLVC